MNTGILSDSDSRRKFLPILLVLFFGSGSAALIYEIVWFQMLQLIIGSSAVSLGVLLGTYMGGMCLGSLVLPRLISPHRHPFRVYALLELGIGLIGIALLFGMPLIDRFYMVTGASGFSGILLRALVCSVCLLPPTILMGATLPAAARWLENSPRGISRMGFLYGANTIGAVFGCLSAGFYLLRVHNSGIATFSAAALNGLIALTAFGLSFAASYRSPAHSSSDRSGEKPHGVRVVYAAIAVSGLCALGAEVVWTRLLSMLLGGTVYTFAIILAVFLFGLGIGSHAGSMIARSTKRPGQVLGWLQVLLCAAAAWAAFAIARSLPYWPIDTSLFARSSIHFQLDIIRCLWALLPAALLWGASFPLALAAASRGQDSGRLVGGIYASNTIGAIAGSLGFSMIIIPALGTRNAQRIIIGLSAAAGFLLLLPGTPFFRPSKEKTDTKKFQALPHAAVPAVLTAVVLLALTVPKIPWQLVAFGRRMPVKTEKTTLHFMGEGMNSSIAVSKSKEGWLNFHVGGKVVASSDSWDMRVQNMLGHLPALLHPNPKSVLIVGCGAGVTAGTFVNYPGVERIVICEIEPLIPKTAAAYFGSYNNSVLNDPRVEVVIDDARHYILKTRESFDIVTSDPIHPWLKGSAVLYSREYFELCLRRLNPGGLVTQWVPLYESIPEVVKSELATFFTVFPEGTVWSNDFNSIGYDLVLLGKPEKMNIDVDVLQKRLESPELKTVSAELEQIGFRTAVDLLATYAGRGQDLDSWLQDAVINTDRTLRLQYLAGLGLNAKESQLIFMDLMEYLRYPEDLFTGSEQQIQSLRNTFVVEEK